MGKTRLLASASDIPELSPVLILDVEGGTFSIREKFPDVDVIRISSWAEMSKVYNDLYDGNHPYKTVGLDSLTEIQKMGMYGIMTALVAEPDNKDRDPDIPSVREWGKNIEQTRKLVRAFRDLPMNVIFTALEMSDRNPRTGLTVTKPSLSGKLSGEVAGFLDEVLYMYVKTVDNEPQRLLLTRKTEDKVAKDRSDKLPQVITDVTMKTIHNHMFSTANN